ncbi:hypothetical protein B0J17DRAFT_655511 [Rhizoctonia solani]|nr:hypothetical protein B0J17DRAFT_655511 [Rhizoctonia solani]
MTTMDQANISLANRRPHKSRVSSDGIRAGIILDISSPSSSPASRTQAAGTETGRESRWNRIGNMCNFLLARCYVLSRSVPWIPRQASSVQICVRSMLMLYVLFSLVTFNPLIFCRWLFSGGSLDLAHQPWTSLWTSSRTDVYGAMPTSLLFSKLSPHLGNLAPNAVQIMSGGHKREDGPEQTEPDITSCIWIPDTHIRALESWTGLDEYPISVLVTTNQVPDSPTFRKLTKDITGIVHRKLHTKDTILLVSSQRRLSNTNTYINLARLFARTDWVLLVPPIFEPLLPASDIAQTVSRLNYRVQILDPTLFFRSSDNRVPAMDGILVPQNSSIWCSERYYVSDSGSEWSDCIQETLSYHYGVDASNSTDSGKGAE